MKGLWGEVYGEGASPPLIVNKRLTWLPAAHPACPDACCCCCSNQPRQCGRILSSTHAPTQPPPLHPLLQVDSASTPQQVSRLLDDVRDAGGKRIMLLVGCPGTATKEFCQEMAQVGAGMMHRPCIDGVAGWGEHGCSTCLTGRTGRQAGRLALAAWQTGRLLPSSAAARSSDLEAGMLDLYGLS